MKYKIYFGIVIVILGLAIFLRYKQNHLPTVEVEIGGNRIKAELASSPSSRELGLAGREAISPAGGMLFVFPQLGRHAFWMKGMKFAIDIIWINGDKIVDIAPKVMPSDSGEPRVYVPRDEANFVLEVASGGAELRGWKIGDRVEINN